MHHRPTERADLKRILLSGNSVLMLAPRRVGKTWLMEQVDQDLTQDGHLCIRFDAAGKRTEKVFLKELCDAVERHKELHEAALVHLKHRWRALKGGDSGGSLSHLVDKVDPRSFLEGLVESLHRPDRRTVIMIDEFSFFVLDMAKADPDEVRSLLYHMRSLQQRFPGVTWLLTGSIGLDAVARRHDLNGAFTDLRIFGLDPFTEAEAGSFLNELSSNGLLGNPFRVEDDVLNYLCQQLGWLIPYHLQEVCTLVRPTGPSDEAGRVGILRGDVDDAFDRLLSPRQRSRFAPWEEHLRKNFVTEDTARLRVILDHCCQTPDGEQENTIQGVLSRAFPTITRPDTKNLLGCLDNDGFLMKDGARWRFRSGLLRRYWLEYMCE